MYMKLRVNCSLFIIFCLFFFVLIFFFFLSIWFVSACDIIVNYLHIELTHLFYLNRDIRLLFKRLLYIVFTIKVLVPPLNGSTVTWIIFHRSRGFNFGKHTYFLCFWFMLWWNLSFYVEWMIILKWSGSKLLGTAAAYCLSLHFFKIILH